MRRHLSRTFERLHARPLGLAVFLASVGLLVALQSTQLGRFRARAVAEARAVEHPALVASFVTAVHVQPGDAVESGRPLGELSPHFIERELSRVTVRIEELLHEAELARAQLAVDEERWLDPQLRMRPSRPSLQRQTESFFAAQLELLETRRAQLVEDRAELTISSRASGRVAFVLGIGSGVAVGTSIASVIPEQAQEVVAYVAPQTDPALIAPGVQARLLGSLLQGCQARATVQRRGAGVVQAPGQLEGFLGLPVHGLPVYISIPDGCALGVGQVLSVEFAKAG